jgi:hypothetical protein
MTERDEIENFEKEHNCSQGATLAVICEKLERIEGAIIKIEKKQDAYISKLNEIAVNDAKYPTADQMGVMVRTLERHNTYFTIFGAALVSAWGLIIVIISKLWS